MMKSVIGSVSVGLLVPFFAALIEMMVGVLLIIGIKATFLTEPQWQSAGNTAMPLIVLGCLFSSFVGLIWSLRYGLYSIQDKSDQIKAGHIYARMAPGLGALVLAASCAGTIWAWALDEHWKLSDLQFLLGVGLAQACVMTTTAFGWSFRQWAAQAAGSR